MTTCLSVVLVTSPVWTQRCREVLTTLGKSFDAFELEKEIMTDGLLIKERETVHAFIVTFFPVLSEDVI